MEGLQIGSRHELDAPIAEVAKALARLMKPTRHTISVVKTLNGKIEEINGWTVVAPNDIGPPHRTPAPANPDALVEKTPKPGEEPVAAATVAKPTQGCPAPDFVRAEIKARAVLDVFLTDEQREDFRKYNRFVSMGAYTGHRYMITSRHARDELAQFQRSLYDLDERRPYCVHDWVVPAAEEMLALHLMLQVPAHEPYLRHLDRE